MAHPIRQIIAAQPELTSAKKRSLLKSSASVGVIVAATMSSGANAYVFRPSPIMMNAAMAEAGASEAVLMAEQQTAAPDVAISTDKAETADDEFNIEFRADTLVLTPVMSVGIADSEGAVVATKTAHFQTFNNYPSFLAKEEIRVFEAGKSPDSEPFAIIATDENGAAFWEVPADSPTSLFYVYRVTDKAGNFDETNPQEITVVPADMADSMRFGPKPRYPEFGVVDQAARRNIQMTGIMGTATGQADPRRDVVVVSGQRIPVDDNGRFAVQQVIPRSQATMEVIILRDGKQIHSQKQALLAPASDWFVVGHGDLTLGKSYNSGPVKDVSGDDQLDGTFALGRAAFYAKGVVGEDVKITASLDTGETLVKDLFSNLDRKDPRQLLRRWNTEQYYPTYGDNSTLVEDAPTQGRFYLRVEKDANQLLIGNFTVQATGAELAQLDRGLFGALAELGSEKTTEFGEKKFHAIAFASDPGTVPGRQEFAGTGGSLYYLKHQDVSIGSERVRVEVRDRETGLVLESRELYAEQDYDFDPFHGRLTLLRPLASTVSTGETVRDGSSAGNIPVLVVRYEYTPPVGELDGYTLGARGTGWLTDLVRVGVTAQRDTVEEASQTLYGADVMLRLAAATYVKAEFAQTKGPGFGQSNSIDGGLSYTDWANPGLMRASNAWRAEIAVDIAELQKRTGDKGKLAAYYEHFDQGFSSVGRLMPSETERWGAAATLPLGKDGNVSIKYDELFTQETGRKKTGIVDVANRFAAGSGNVIVKGGLRYDDVAPGQFMNSTQLGQRTDAAIEIAYSPLGETYRIHAFGQATLDRDDTRFRNNRVGGGVKAQFTERLSLESELSGGDGGMGANVQLNHRLGNGSEAYVGYALFADTNEIGLDPQNLFSRSNKGTFVVGSRHRFSDSFSVHGENKIGIGGSAPSLTRSFGLSFDPTERLSVTGSFENGRIDNAETGQFKRTAASLAVGYTGEGFRLGSAVEFRNDDGAGRDQSAWMFRNTINYSVNPDWQFLAQLNFAFADEDSPSLRAAEFTDAMAGFAYRPVYNERLNALVRVRYYEDLGPAGQLTGSGQTESPKQISTIFSADVNYDLNERLTVGAKYGYRQGKVSLSRQSDDFVKSDAHLAVLRLDYNVTKEWDVMAEGRALWVEEADDMRLGGLGAIYRHVNNNVKIGVGYSWSDFSDDLTDQSYTSHGPFLNIIGKF